MSNPTVTPIRTRGRKRTSGGCGCDFLAAGMTLDNHNRLLGLELSTALEAVEICAELAMCEIHERFNSRDFTRFAAQHSRYYTPSMARLAMLLDDLSAGYRRNR
jgi:hypothetical protein